MSDDFDPELDDDDLLAVSALLDGDATDEQRRRVGAVPALRAMYDDLLVLRGPLADVPAPAAARESAPRRHSPSTTCSTPHRRPTCDPPARSWPSSVVVDGLDR